MKEDYEPFVYVEKSEDEITQLALDIADGKVYGTWLTEEGQDPFLPFVPFRGMMMESKQFCQDVMDQEIVHVYEYYSNGRRMLEGVPGLAPTFFSCHDINKSDWQKVRAIIDKLQEAKKQFDENKKAVMAEPIG